MRTNFTGKIDDYRKRGQAVATDNVERSETNMIAKQIGSLKRLELRTIWPNEAADFTPWLAENLKVFDDLLGLNLELQRIEAAVGPFSLDILAKDLNADRVVIIENQLQPTDHDHLGKLLTYAAGFDASKLIWIAKEFHDEHRSAIDWLNRHTDEDTEFFGIVVEALQIDDSKPAYNFRLVAFPDGWSKGRTTSPLSSPSSKQEAYREYFQKLIDELRERYHFTGARTAQLQSWYSFASGISGISYSHSFAKGEEVRAELFLGRTDENDNRFIFDQLLAAKDAIETEFGEPLEWERLDGKKAKRVAIYRPGAIEDADMLGEIRDWAVQKLLKLKKVLGPRLDSAWNNLQMARSSEGQPSNTLISK